nr:reverse transcriptase domain-containing protein [Tanacetum cinerariifolium]
DNIQEYASAAAVNYNKGSGSLPSNTVANPKGEFKAITTRSGLVTDGPTISALPKSVIPKVGERVKETFTDPDLAEYTIKVPSPLYQKMIKALLSNKEKLQELANTPLNENCSAVILKKLPKKLGDPGKFLIPCGFSELKCKALANLGASINLMPLSVWKKLGLPELISTRITLELANRAICTPAGIARDVFIPVGKFNFSANFVIVDYESDPRVPLILGRPFLRTAHALIDVYGEEVILRDGDERLTLNMKYDTTSYSNHPQRESANLINSFHVSSEHFLEVSVSNQQSGNPALSLHQEFTSLEVTHEIHDLEGCNLLSEILPDIDAFNDIHPHFDDNPLSGSTTYSANSLLEEFTDELALITYPPDNDDNLQFDIESDLKEIEFLLFQGKDSSLKDLSIQTDLANLDDYFVDPIPEMFTEEHAPDYSSPLKFDVYVDDFLENESYDDNFYDDPFDSEGEKIIESKLLMDELDLPYDSLLYSESDLFNSLDFSRVDDLPSPNNKDKVFNPRIPIHEKSVTIITRVTQEKKLAISYASRVFKDFEPSFCAPLFFKDVLKSRMLLPFSTENKEKVFKPGIHTSGKDCPDCEVFHALSIVLYLQELHILSFILGIQGVWFKAVLGFTALLDHKIQLEACFSKKGGGKPAITALYNGHEIIKDNHVSAIVHNTLDTLEIVEITRKKMNDKMKDPECVTHKVKIAPHDYSKENFLATFTHQKQLTPEQIFWSNDLIKLKSEALKEQTTVSGPIKALTVGFEQTKECYLKEVIPFFKTLKDNFEGIQKALTNEIKEMKDVFEELEAKVAQNVVDRKHDAIKRKNLLIANDNLIVECLSKEVFSVATNSELNVARFTEMHIANTLVEARCLVLEAKLANLCNKSHHDNQEELINRFSKLEATHLDLQLKYQNLKDGFGNNPPTSDTDTPDFDTVFVIGKMQASLQGKDNVIRQLKKQSPSYK